MEKRLSGRKRIYLSKEGRLTLTKSTIFNLLTYFLSLFPLPASVAKQIEYLFRSFLLGSLEEERKILLVNWQRVFSLLSIGGLGMRNLILFNKVILGK